ncbi:MAG: thioredoxin family protein [Anaerohalosphaera sp.]|nr:thioredoxin family protein [Anaerohalosphaera sp.]
MTKNANLSLVLVVLLALAITAGGCNKKEDNTPQPAPEDQTQVKTETPAIELTPAHNPTDETIPEPKVEVEKAAVTEPAKEPVAETEPAAEKDIWIQDYEKAIKLAADQGKDIIMDFTGSDWCGWCIKLDKEVFTQQTFIDEIPKKFVLLKLDYPRNKSILTEEVIAQNKDLKNKYSVSGFPTIFVTDAAGKPYAKTGYQKGGPEKYIEHLYKMQGTKTRIAEFIKKAGDQAASGTDKAKLIDEALSLLPEGTASVFYGDLIDQIIESDNDNKAGLKDKYVKSRKLDAIRQAMSSKDFKKAIEMTDAIIVETKPTGETLQELYLTKSEAYFRDKNKDEAKKTLQLALDAAPETKTAGQIKNIMARNFPEEKPADEPVDTPADTAVTTESK